MPSLLVDIAANVAHLQRDMATAGKHVKGLNDNVKKAASMMKTAFAAIGTGLVVREMKQLIDTSLNMADSIAKTADKLGVSTDALQEYRYAAKLSGVETSTFDMALQRFTRRVGEAAQGKGELKDTLLKYNIAVRDATGRTRTIEAVLNDLSNTIKNAESDQERLRIAFKAFDSEGAALVNMLRGGADELNNMREKARSLGLVIDQDLIRNAEDAKDSLETLSWVIKTQLTTVILELAPLITEIANGLIDISRSVSRFFGIGVQGLIKEKEEAKKHLEDLRDTLEKGFYLEDEDIRLIDVDQINRDIAEVEAKISDLSELIDIYNQKRAASGRPTDTATAPGVPAGTGMAKALQEDFQAAKDWYDNWISTTSEANKANLTIFEMEQEEFKRIEDEKLAYHQETLEQVKALNEQSAGDYLGMQWAVEEAALRHTEEVEQAKVKAKQMGWKAAQAIELAALAWGGQTARTVFQIVKSAEAAKATVAAFAAANEALANPPGPPWTIPLAAATLAYGLANVAAIVGTAFGGGAGGSSAAPALTGGGAVATYEAPAIGQTETTEERGTLTIIIEGDFIGDEGYIENLVEKINKAQDERDVFVRATSAKYAEKLQ